ncbi:hypothetical protein SAMN05444365_101960 [Micromonospora pattaloongensis]|uniref:Uncharacterized protein n=1 Tax=Micromonospora pattaloongensis TaxID=405436 RepID=A0A1H3HRE6_9ACTN|nr:hypothetical protein [Micromonospora pattaloongensis]SDY18101.1 hypothetical protein SAMN05444365_101960 [Micromonospora pattaloongensis]
MPHRGPSGGDPHPGRRPPEAYGRPAEPRAAEPRAAEPRAAGPDGRAGRPDPAAGDGRYYAAAVPSPDTRPPARSRPRWWMVLAVVVPLLVIVGAGTVIRLLGGDGDTAAGPGEGASGRAPAPQAGSSDARFVKAGECLRNEGEPRRPKLVIATCGPATYEVLARFDGATAGEADAKQKCRAVPGYTDWFYFKTEFNALDYVLCLKLR